LKSIAWVQQENSCARLSCAYLSSN
jgi:hypothetical protein